MAALRAFLMLRTPSMEWKVSVHRDFDEVLRAWKERPEPELTGAVFHIGFDRPPSHTFDGLIGVRAGQVLLTASAMFALPHGFLASSSPVGHVGNLPIFLATHGWGYVAEEEKSHIQTAPISQFVAVGWVGEFLNTHPDAIEAFSEANISDEDSYLTNEQVLEAEDRRISALFRFEKLIGKDREDPCACARVSPPWLGHRRLETLGLTVRITNVFSVLGIRTVYDLNRFSLQQLLKTPNFGRRSVADLLAILDRGLKEGPKEEKLGLSKATNQTTFLQSVRHSLLEFTERERDILRRRMGLDGPSETLQEIGEIHGVTRERIRQVEAKVLKRILLRENWDELLKSKLKAVLGNREAPMPLLGIEAADPWFNGIARARDALRYTLVSIGEGRSANIVTVNGIDYIAFMTPERWQEAIDDARRLLEGGVGKGWTESYCRLIVGALLPATAPEFRSLLWEEAAKYCHFVSNGESERLLGTYGRGVDSLVEAVLQAAETPIHYSEIAFRASKKSGREIDVRRAHNAAAEVGLLFGRGTFGLYKHLPLSSEALNALAVEAEELVLDGPTDRQWHTSEMLVGLLEGGSSVASKADKYIVDIALQTFSALKRLGRMVWSQEVESGELARIDIRQAVIAVVRDAHRPLHSSEIKQRLLALRGINKSFQIFSADPLLRVAPGVWGLNDRDFSIKRESQKRLAEDFISRLEQRQTGIHVSELKDELGSSIPANISAVGICSLLTLDERIRTGAAHYLFLAKWGEPRRESIGEAVERVLIRGKPLSSESIVSQVEQRIGRACERHAITSCLYGLGATFDHRTLLWSAALNSQSNVNDEESISQDGLLI